MTEEIDIERVRRVAGSVKDPEVRTSIAELGLLDQVEVDGGRVTVRFHLTWPLCLAKFAGAIGQDGGHAGDARQLEQAQLAPPGQGGRRVVHRRITPRVSAKRSPWLI
ncbi:MAG TPA: iron-sulfur cluster assembly protein, partial [Actinomycetes bacterium]|nr:iron-sulfur cluster assembly protein [Actinomycetes bacterium]